MQQSLFKRYTLLAQICFWCVLFCLIFFSPEFRTLTIEERLPIVMADLVRSAILVYLNYLILIPKYLMRRDYKKYVFFIILLMGANILFESYWFADNSVVIFGGSLAFHLFFSTLVNFFFLGITSLYKFVEFWFDNIRIREQLRSDKLEAELNFLKTQINPHFLFNILNNIYTLAYMKDDKAAPMVAKLSEMMRYMLYECGENRVLLSKEISLLQHYVDLQLLKVESHVNVDFYTEGIRNEHVIAPLLLVSFVENCFKHGDLDINPNGWIAIHAEVDDKNELWFSAANSSRVIPTNEHSKGIGLKNVKRQLSLHYPKAHRLEISETETEFKVDLYIDLNEKKRL